MILQRLGNSLRNLNTLSQGTGYPNYRLAYIQMSGKYLRLYLLNHQMYYRAAIHWSKYTKVRWIGDRNNEIIEFCWKLLDLNPRVPASSSGPRFSCGRHLVDLHLFWWTHLKLFWWRHLNMTCKYKNPKSLYGVFRDGIRSRVFPAKINRS